MSDSSYRLSATDRAGNLVEVRLVPQPGFGFDAGGWFDVSADGMKTYRGGRPGFPDDVVSQAALLSGVSRAYIMESLATVSNAYREQHEERVAAAHRRAWSGPDKVERQILRAFGVSAQQIGSAPRSVFSPGYRQRQRNRVKRRRR